MDYNKSVIVLIMALNRNVAYAFYVAEITIFLIELVF